jgi:hypothetical protein
VNRLFGTLLLGMALYFVSPLLGENTLRIVVPLYLAAAGCISASSTAPRAMRWFTVGRRLRARRAAARGLGRAAERAGARRHPLAAARAGRARAHAPATADHRRLRRRLVPALRRDERSTFVDPEVTRTAEHFATFFADVTESNQHNESLLAKFKVVGVPTVIFYGSNGAEVERLVGYVEADVFARTMRRVLGAAAPGHDKDKEMPSLTRLREQGGDVVAARPGDLAPDHVGAQRVDVEATPREQLAHQSSRLAGTWARRCWRAGRTIPAVISSSALSSEAATSGPSTVAPPRTMRASRPSAATNTRRTRGSA